MPYQLSRVPEAKECDTLAEKFPELVRAVRNKAGCEAVNSREDGVARATAESAEQIGSGWKCSCQVSCEQCDLREGDLVVLCTDGVTDNLWPSRISGIVSEAVSPMEARRIGCTPTPPEEVASALTGEALEKSKMTRRYKSPFAAAFRAHYGTFYSGGKRDDITAVAAWVMSSVPTSPSDEGVESVERRDTFDSFTTSKSSDSL
ncbi:hypothetical protein FOZ63_012726 [Perkinsus olseni]|uniref:Protein phosphatase n=1 Tax=Perkinsus olseni TaxID=32597 RepID=A0A7J6TLS9_PEROL|nr:hypothetical protein FOZ63_012726 [Perkinsus olseni]